ncbi:MAG: RloB family protein [Candidatus Riflebacteria bacterium]|jgi:hypothetical protein|nr:RloB family protein [Candidatus Riflebacteria bacterium]MDD3377963.1 RloB family protein [Candidatus Riflebacteria bacterium]
MTKKKINGYEPKKRNSNKRRRKSIVIISAEGKNKTEKLYLSKFSNDTYNIKFAPGNTTDPENMIKTLIEAYRDNGLNTKYGDLAYCLVDADCDSRKNDQLAGATNLANKHNIELIVSAPCFEIWYLCHFNYSTKRYKSNEDVIKELRQYIPGYQKSCDSLYNELLAKIKIAISNAKKLEKHNLEIANRPHTVEFSPSTEVYKVIEKIISN